MEGAITMNLGNKKVCFLGDSITEGAGVGIKENRYTDVFKRITDIGEMKNYGIGGTRIAKQITVKEESEYWDINSFSERFNQMDDDADIVVVFGGTNDYGHGDAPFGTEDDRDMTTYCGACHYLMSGLIKKYPKSTIVFMTPIHRENENVLNESNGLNLKAYVDVIKNTANYYSIPVLDLYAVGGIYPDIAEHKEAWCPDGLHPNDAGAEKIAYLLANFLKNL